VAGSMSSNAVSRLMAGALTCVHLNERKKSQGNAWR